MAQNYKEFHDTLKETDGCLYVWKRTRFIAWGSVWATTIHAILIELELVFSKNKLEPRPCLHLCQWKLSVLSTVAFISLWEGQRANRRLYCLNTGAGSIRVSAPRTLKGPYLRFLPSRPFLWPDVFILWFFSCFRANQTREVSCLFVDSGFEYECLCVCVRTISDESSLACPFTFSQCPHCGFGWA